MEESSVVEIIEALRTISMDEQQRPPYRDYKTILQSSLVEALASKAMSMLPDDAETLLSHLRIIPPHPEVPALLQQLRTDYRLGIISNTDDDLIAGTITAISVSIDYVITAQQAKAYEPNHQLFRHAHTMMGVAPEETVHVGLGQITDLKVCHQLGIRAVWIDRLAETLNTDWAPAAILRDLRGLPDLLS